MNELEEARNLISRTDEQIAGLFAQRMEAVKRIAAYKKENGLPIRDPAREEALIARNRLIMKDPDTEGPDTAFMRHLLDVSCRYQETLIQGRKVAFSGVEGAFAHIAARRLFPEARFVGYGGFEPAYRATESGECDCAVLPLENSYAGEVGTVMDLLFTGSLFVNQVMDLPVRHGLMVCPEGNMGSIRRVYSHSQALHQCEGYLQGRGWETVECSNTATAARMVRDMNDPSAAAIASEETAELYGLKLLENGINDQANNTTRFAVLSRSQNRPSRPGLADNAGFILVFTVQNRAGALAQTLNIIGAHGYNMKTLRSRPMKGLQWDYYFYIEAEGNIATENGNLLLRELGPLCARLKLVGIY